jgi:hypothetical protein
MAERIATGGFPARMDANRPDSPRNAATTPYYRSLQALSGGPSDKIKLD